MNGSVYQEMKIEHFMATIVNEKTQQVVILQPQHVFGRHPTAATSLESLEASRTHAVVIWDGESWVLQDTSSNGTFINGKALARDNKKGLKGWRFNSIWQHFGRFLARLKN